MKRYGNLITDIFKDMYYIRIDIFGSGKRHTDQFKQIKINTQIKIIVELKLILLNNNKI